MFSQCSNFRKVVGVCGVIAALINEFTTDCGLLGYETKLAGGYRCFGGISCSYWRAITSKKGRGSEWIHVFWKRVVSFTPWPFYPLGKILPYLLDRSLGGPQSRSGQRGDEKNNIEGHNRNIHCCGNLKSSTNRPVVVENKFQIIVRSK
jgi:hypothetical protein